MLIQNLLSTENEIKLITHTVVLLMLIILMFLLVLQGSRDGKIAVWTKNSTSSESSLKDYSSCCSINLPSESITALCFSRSFFNENNYLLAIGLESGIIQIYSFNGTTCQLLSSLNNSDAHHLTVNKLEFRPSENKIHLASCGNDHLVRIYEIE